MLSPKAWSIERDFCMKAPGSRAARGCARRSSKPDRYCSRSIWIRNISAKESRSSISRLSGSPGNPNIGFVYNQQSFRQLRSFNYPGEGWALTNDGQNIYMDDGTAQIRVWDPVTLQEKRRITVRDHGQPILNLNELEWVRGEIYANIWQTDRIARISPMDGRVLGWIDLTGILPPSDRTDRGRCFKRNRLRCFGQPAVRDGQAVAQAVRDQISAASPQEPVKPIFQLRIPGALLIGLPPGRRVGR